MKPARPRKKATAKRRTIAPYRWHGCWELDKREAVARCRWFIVYQRLTDTEFYGIVSGYAGGGAFAFEDFFVRLKNGKIASCVIDDLERVSGKPASLKSLHKRHRNKFNEGVDAYAVFEEFNYGWGYDVQYLVGSAIDKFGLIAEDEDKEFPNELSFVGGTASSPWVKELLSEYFWTTASPGVLRPRISAAERSAGHALARAWIPKLSQRAAKLQKQWDKE